MNDNVCPICYETIGIDNCSVTPCNHRFHCNCLIEHVYTHSNTPNCPVCRQEGLRVNTVTGLSGVHYDGSGGFVAGPSGLAGPTGFTGYYSSQAYPSPIIYSISNLIHSYTTIDSGSSDLVNINVVLQPSGNTTANITCLRQTGEYGVSRMTDAFANSVRSHR